MAKNISPLIKLQGTIGDLTFVNSKRYKPHTRARKNSKTPFVMTPALAESKDRLPLCNQYAMPVYHALRSEAHDGGLWSRMVKQLFAELKAGRPLGLECLKGFECNLQHKLSEVIAGGYDFSATVAQNQLSLHVLLHRHPKVDDKLPRAGYQLRFVVIIPDAVNGTVHKQEVLGPLTQYDAKPEAIDLTISLPATDAPCMLLMGMVPHLQGEGAVRIMSDSGMKVVWASDNRAVEVEEVAINADAGDVPVGEYAEAVAVVCEVAPVVGVVDQEVAPVSRETTTQPVYFFVNATSMPRFQSCTDTAVDDAGNESVKADTPALVNSTEVCGDSLVERAGIGAGIADKVDRSIDLPVGLMGFSGRRRAGWPCTVQEGDVCYLNYHVELPAIGIFIT